MCVLNSGEATRVPAPPARETRLDLSLCSNSLRLECTWKVIQDPHGSDHLPIAISVSNGSHQADPVDILYDLTRNIDWKKYAETILETVESTQKLEPLGEYNFLASVIYESAIKAQTKRFSGQKFRSRPPNPWWDTECKEAYIAKSAAFVEWRGSGLIRLFQMYASLEHKFNSLVKAKKRGYWRKFVEGLTRETSMSTLWKVARNMRNRSQSNEDAEYSNRWIFEFAKKVCPDSAPAQQTFREGSADDLEPPFSMAEFSVALLSCNNSAPGTDRIKFNLLKNLPDAAKKRLLHLFNALLDQNIVPDEWREVRVIAIQKPGKPASDYNSYRPISMLSCIRKLLEKMILRRLDHWAESKKLLSPTQYGFRRGKGTSDCLALLATEVDIAFGEKKQMASVFLDIKGAFDSVSIEVLSDKLHRDGLSPKLNNFLVNLLGEKHMSFAHGSSSTQRISYMGLPQGSCLSPLLYNIYVNEIDGCLVGNCTLRQLADDGVVSVVGTNGISMQQPLQESLDNLSGWANALGIEFSPEKTEMVVFCKHRDPARFQLELSGRVITQSLFFKYLGVYFDSKGTWGKHVGYLKQKCQKRVNFMRSISGSWWGAHPLDMIRLYKTTILSVMEYGSFCFRAATKTHILQLERIQYRCLRIALGCMHSTHTMSIEVLAGVLPLQERFYELSLRFLMRCETANPLVIGNFEQLLNLQNQTKRMTPYHSFITMKTASVLPPEQTYSFQSCNTNVIFDLSMQNLIRGIPEHLRSLVIPALFSTHYGHIDQEKQFYTDGSNIDGSTGFGVFHMNHNIFRKLEDPCSVYVSELAAIFCALNIIETMPADNYFIFSDSFSSIEAIRSLKDARNPTYFLLEIRRSLRALADLSFIVTLVWVPAHCSIPGNEKADLLAKKGALEGELLKRPITYKEYLSRPRQDALVSWQTQWSRGDKGRWLHSIYPRVSLKPWFKGFDVSRDFIRGISRLMANHYISNAHLFRIGLKQSPLCECGSGYQDIDHIVWSCSNDNNVYRDARSRLNKFLRDRGRPPNIPIRDLLAIKDFPILLELHHFLKAVQIKI